MPELLQSTGSFPLLSTLDNTGGDGDHGEHPSTTLTKDIHSEVEKQTPPRSLSMLSMNSECILLDRNQGPSTPVPRIFLHSPLTDDLVTYQSISKDSGPCQSEDAEDRKDSAKHPTKQRIVESGHERPSPFSTSRSPRKANSRPLPTQLKKTPRKLLESSAFVLSNQTVCSSHGLQGIASTSASVHTASLNDHSSGSSVPKRTFIAPPRLKKAESYSSRGSQADQADNMQTRQFIGHSPSPPRASLPSPAPSDEIIFPWPPRSSTPLRHSAAKKSGKCGARASSIPRTELTAAQLSLSSPPPSPVRTHRKAKAYSEKAHFEVFVEDTDEEDVLIRARLNSQRPSASDTSVAQHSSNTRQTINTRSYAATTVLPQSGALYNSAKPVRTPPPFSGGPEFDKFVGSAVATSSVVQTSLLEWPSWTKDRAITMCSSLASVFRDSTRYKKFLNLRDDNAQCLLNCIQMLLDNLLNEEQVRVLLLGALIKLSKKSGLYPQCFTLTEVVREEEYPVADGPFCEIHTGCLHGRVICLKIVKMYTVSDRDQYRNAFYREAVLWGQMLHPNVLPFYGIYSLGDARHRIALISPWLPNGTINEFLKKNPDSNRQVLISGVAAGMSYLHQNQVVHGDIKGANILITDSGRACLTDFGLSSLAEAHGVQHPAFTSSGTARFQAPELIDPSIEYPRSKPSDVYAFAMTCYQIFTGHLPFYEAKRDYGVLLKVGRGERPERPLEPFYHDRGLSDAMWGLMQECWEQLPDKRLSASQIVQRLPKKSIGDLWGQGNWDQLSSLRFREREGCTNQHDYVVNILGEAIHILQTTGAFVS